MTANTLLVAWAFFWGSIFLSRARWPGWFDLNAFLAFLSLVGFPTLVLYLERSQQCFPAP